MFNNSQTINISSSTIFRAILIALAFVFLYIIRDILITVFVAIIIAAAVAGPVNWLQKRKVPRVLSVIFIYLVILLVLAFIITLILPTIIEQVKQLAKFFPEFMEQTSLSMEKWWGDYRLEGNLQSLLNQFSGRLEQATSSIFATIVALFGGLFSAIVILVISFYLSVRENGVKGFLLSLTPQEHHNYVSDLIDRIQIKIGGWLRGQLLLMLLIGVLTYIGLRLLNVDYALTLALIAGLFEIIPYIGPIVSAIPAVVLAFFQFPLLALAVFILYIVIQQLENYLIVPLVMRRAVGLNPVIIIIVMLVGAKLAGVLGIILAVPFSAGLTEFLKDIRKQGA